MSLRILVVAIALAIPALAHADPKADAKQHITRAAQFHSAGKFADALKELTLAYALDPEPELLFAIGQVHMKLGNCTDAVTFYQRFLASKPDASDAAVVNEAITRCDADKPAPVEVTPPALPVVEPAPVSAVPVPVLPPAPTPLPPSPWYADGIGDTFVGTGIVAGAIAGVLYHAALGHRDRVDSATTYNDYTDELDAAHHDQTYALVAGSAAVVLAGIGVVHYLVHGGRASAEHGVAVIPKPDGGLVAWHTRF